MTFPERAVGDQVLLKGWQPEAQRRAEVIDVADAPMIRVRMAIDGSEVEIASFAMVAVAWSAVQ